MVFWAQGERQPRPVHGGRGTTLSDSAPLRYLRDQGIEDNDWLDRWYPLQAKSSLGFSHAKKDNLKRNTRLESEKCPCRGDTTLTGLSQTQPKMSLSKHRGDLEDHQQVYSITSAHHFSRDGHLSSLIRNVEGEGHRGMSLLDRIGKNISTLGSNQAKETKSLSSHKFGLTQNTSRSTQDPTLPSPRNVEGALASPFYDPDFWVPRRPLAPNRLYHFNVIYNHEQSELGRSSDADLALRVTASLVEKLEFRGYVNGYYHDRDRRSDHSLVAELERVISSSSLTILLLTPGFIRDCLDRYLQVGAFRQLLAQQNSARGQLVIMGVGVTQASLPLVLGRHEVLFFKENDWENDHPAWTRLDNTLLGSLGEKHKIRSSERSESEGQMKQNMKGDLHQEDAPFTRFPRTNHCNWALDTDGLSRDLSHQCSGIVLETPQFASTPNTEAARQTSSSLCSSNKTKTKERKETLKETQTVPLYEKSADLWLKQRDELSNANNKDETLCDIKDRPVHVYDQDKTDTRMRLDDVISPKRTNDSADSASGKYFRLTEGLLLADDYHDMGEEHVAWDPGGKHNYHTFRSPLFNSPKHQPVEVSYGLRYGSEDGDECGECSDGESDVTVLDNTLDSIRTDEDPREKFGFESFKDVLFYKQPFDFTMENVHTMSSMEKEETRLRFGTENTEKDFLCCPSLDTTQDSVHTLDTVELDEMRMRYEFESFQNTKFQHHSLNDTFDSVHTLDSEELLEMRRRYGFENIEGEKTLVSDWLREIGTRCSYEDPEVATPRSESSVNSLDTVGLGELRQRYGFERPVRLEEHDIYDYLSYDDLDDTLGWPLQTSDGERTEDDLTAQLVSFENENLKHSQFSHELNNDQKLGLYPGVDALREELNVVNSQAPEDTWYDTRSRRLRMFRAEQGHFESSLLRTQPSIEVKHGMQENALFPDTPTIEELWAKWVDSPVSEMDDAIETDSISVHYESNYARAEDTRIKENYLRNSSADETGVERVEHHLTDKNESKPTFTERPTQNESSDNATLPQSKDSDLSEKSRTCLNHLKNAQSKASFKAKITIQVNETATSHYQNSQVVHADGDRKMDISVDENGPAESKLNSEQNDLSISVGQNRSRSVQALNEAIKDAVISVVGSTPRDQEDIWTNDQVNSTVFQKGTKPSDTVDSIQRLHDNVTNERRERFTTCDHISIIKGRQERVKTFNRKDVQHTGEEKKNITKKNHDCTLPHSGTSIIHYSRESSVSHDQSIALKSAETTLPEAETSNKHRDKNFAPHELQNTFSPQAAQKGNNDLSANEANGNTCASKDESRGSEIQLERVDTVSKTKTDSCETLTETRQLVENHNSVKGPREQHAVRDIIKEQNRGKELVTDKTTEYELCGSSEVRDEGREKSNELEGTLLEKGNSEELEGHNVPTNMPLENERHASSSGEICEVEAKFTVLKNDLTSGDTTQLSHAPKSDSSEERDRKTSQTFTVNKQEGKVQIPSEDEIQSDISMNENPESALNQVPGKQEIVFTQLNVVALNIAHEILTHILMSKTFKSSTQAKFEAPFASQRASFSTSESQVGNNFRSEEISAESKESSATTLKAYSLISTDFLDRHERSTGDETDGISCHEVKWSKASLSPEQSTSGENTLSSSQVEEMSILPPTRNSPLLEKARHDFEEVNILPAPKTRLTLEKAGQDSTRVTEERGDHCDSSKAEAVKGFSCKNSIAEDDPALLPSQALKGTHEENSSLEMRPEKTFVHNEHLDEDDIRVCEIRTQIDGEIFLTSPCFITENHGLTSNEGNDSDHSVSSQEKTFIISSEGTHEEFKLNKETKPAIITKSLHENRYQKGTPAVVTNIETFFDTSVPLGKDGSSVDPKEENKDVFFQANGKPSLVYNVSNIEQIRAVARNITDHIILSSMNLLRVSTPEVFYDERRQHLKSHSLDDEDIPQVYPGCSINTVNRDSEMMDYHEIEHQSMLRSSLEQQISDRYYEQCTNHISDESVNEQFKIDLDAEHSFSETQFVRASSPRLCNDKESGDVFTDTAMMSCSSDMFPSNRAEEEDGGPLSLHELQPESFEGNDEAREMTYYGTVVNNEEIGAVTNLMAADKERIKADTEHCHNGGSLSPRCHHYNEGDSGFFDPCDSLTSRDESEVNLDPKSGSFQATDYRDDHARVKVNRSKIRAITVNPSIQEEIEIRASVREIPNQPEEVNLETGNLTVSFELAHTSDDIRNTIVETRKAVESDSAVLLEEIPRVLKEEIIEEKHISSTVADSFCFREKVLCTTEDLIPQSNQAEFRGASAIEGESTDSREIPGFSQNSDTDFQSEDLNQGTYTDVQQYGLTKDVYTNVERNSLAQNSNTEVVTLSVLRKDTSINIHQDGQDTFTGEQPTDLYCNNETDIDDSLCSQSVKPCTQTSVSSHEIYTDMQLTNDGLSTDIQGTPEQAPSRHDPNSHLLLTDPSHNSRQVSYYTGRMQHSQPDVMQRNRNRVREGVSIVTETLALDPLSIGSLSPRLSSPSLTPRLTPRSRSNFERLRAMHREMRGLSTDGLRLGDTDTRPEEQEVQSSHESSGTRAEQTGTEGGGDQGQQSSSSWFLGIYKGMCHAISKPDMPYMG